MSLISTVQQHRTALAQRDKSAADEMARYYTTIWQRAYHRLDELLKKMQAAEDAGKAIKVSWLYESNRLAELMPQIQQEFDMFAQNAEITTRNSILAGFQLGTQDAQRLLLQVFKDAPPGFSKSFNQVPHGALADLVGAFQNDSPLGKLFDGFGADAAQTIKNALVSGVALGKNPRIIAKDIQQALGDDSLARALVIARDQSIRAYRSANSATYQQNADVLDGWIWSADLSSRTCAMCIAMNGTEHGLDETLDSHVECRCAQVPKPRSWSSLGFSGIPEADLGIQDGSDWFAQQSEATQRSIIGSQIGYCVQAWGCFAQGLRGPCQRSPMGQEPLPEICQGVRYCIMKGGDNLGWKAEPRHKERWQAQGKQAD